MLTTCQHCIDSQFFEAHTWCPTSNSHRAQLLKRSVPSQLLTAHTHTHLKSCTRTLEISGSECEPQLNRPCSYITFAYICHLCYKTQKQCASVSFKSWPHSEERNSSIPWWIHGVMMTAPSLESWPTVWIESKKLTIHLCLQAKRQKLRQGDHIGFSMQSALAPTLWGSNPWLSPAAKGETWKNLQKGIGSTPPTQ